MRLLPVRIRICANKLLLSIPQQLDRVTSISRRCSRYYHCRSFPLGARCQYVRRLHGHNTLMMMMTMVTTVTTVMTVVMVCMMTTATMMLVLMAARDMMVMMMMTMRQERRGGEG
jgi:hypothetical protein